MIAKRIYLLVAVSILLAVTGCGGGGGSSSPAATAAILDTDGDGTGNSTDTDDDGDGVLDTDDAFPLITLGGLTDTDGDGRPNDCDAACQTAGMTADTDDDGDGVLDTADAFPLITLGALTDTNGDGRPNDCDAACQTAGMTADTDDDGDGVLDTDDAFPLVAGSNVDPVFNLSSSCFSVPENSLSVCTITATDADDDSLTFTLSGGSDASDLRLQTDNKLVFVSPPDYESPADNEQNNTYIVIVSVSDGSSTVDYAMTINVTNVEENIMDESGFDQMRFE